MSAILNSLNAHNLPSFQPILMILVLKFMVDNALSDKTYLLLGCLSPLSLSPDQNVTLKSFFFTSIFLSNKINNYKYVARNSSLSVYLLIQ